MSWISSSHNTSSSFFFDNKAFCCESMSKSSFVGCVISLSKTTFSCWCASPPHDWEVTFWRYNKKHALMKTNLIVTASNIQSELDWSLYVNTCWTITVVTVKRITFGRVCLCLNPRRMRARITTWQKGQMIIIGKKIGNGLFWKKEMGDSIGVYQPSTKTQCKQLTGRAASSTCDGDIRLGLPGCIMGLGKAKWSSNGLTNARRSMMGHGLFAFCYVMNQCMEAKKR